MTRQLLGPTGHPISSTVGKTEDELWEEVRTNHVMPDGQTVEKRVRSQRVSAMTVGDRERGKPKPTPVTFDTLRLMARRSEWVAGIIKTRKNQIGKVGWDIVPKDTDDASGATRRMCRAMKKQLSRPSMYGTDPNTRSWRQFVAELLDDLLALDAACIEKERDANGWIVALYPVDGATMRPNINDRGGYYDDAYVQIVDGLVTARFGMEDLVYIMDNPQTDVKFAGYGMSPLENLVVSVTADLYASKFNASYFTKGAVPEGILDLGEDVEPDDVSAFRHYWLNEVVGRPWALPIIGGSKQPQFINWRESNRDMQFMEYQDWLLKKVCAVYQITPQEIGIIEDVNRSTADSQDGTNQSKSIEPILTLLKDAFDIEVVGEHGQGLGDYIEFQWAEEGESAEAVNAKYQPMVSAGAAHREEWRAANGLDDSGDPALSNYLTDGTPQPLPTDADLAVMGAAAQQQQQQDEAEQGRKHEQDMAAKQPAGDEKGGEASAVPWRPADPSHPATQQAMADHDEESGIGPRNRVGKTAPGGRDRHPALTAHEDDLSGLFVSERGRLVEGLAEILEVPAEVLEGIA